MGASVWTFLRPQPGELRPITQRAVEQFISKAGRLPADAEGFVRYAQVVVNLQNRRATEVLHVGFFQHRALKNGRLDRKPGGHGRCPRGRIRMAAAHEAATGGGGRRAQVREATARAPEHLPMPKKTSKLKVTEVSALSEPGMAARLVEAFRASDAVRLARVREDVERHASRVLANALVNTAWRNGPVEDIHAGSFQGLPLDQRRVTLAEERDLMAFASERLALGMTVCLQFSMERPPRPWAEQVLPYGLAEMMLITPSRWTLTEVSRDVRLPAYTAQPIPCG